MIKFTNGYFLILETNIKKRFVFKYLKEKIKLGKVQQI